MKFAASWILVLASVGVLAQAPMRPKITGIDHVVFYTTMPESNAHLYAGVLGLARAIPIERGQTQRFMVGKQWVGYAPAPDAKVPNRMDHIAFTTDDVEALRLYLAANAQWASVPESLTTLNDGSRSFRVQDRQGQKIEFVERPKSGSRSPLRLPPNFGRRPDPVSRRLIHVGFIVRFGTKGEDSFYRDILGFHLYWRGGMQPGQTDWVAMQVPDGTDWIEYMLNVQQYPDQRLTGVMNHISLGVTDMKAAQAKLEAHGWKTQGDEHAQMGKDGKWQLNLFDPDLTRVELMEFTPVEKPCCSEFQGKHPSESE
jgi:catechol 2,3-dioxygenase-like lactoylglutathione lyase family enzyme